MAEIEEIGIVPQYVIEYKMLTNNGYSTIVEFDQTAISLD
jgi:bacterioferritin (cytochrome b1)